MREQERSLETDMSTLLDGKRVKMLADLDGLEGEELQGALEQLPLGTRLAFTQMELIDLKDTGDANFAVTALSKLTQAIQMAVDRQPSE